MNNLCVHLNTFLLITSLQILALGTVALCLAKTFKIHGSAALWMFRLVLLLPFLSPAGWMIAIPKNLSISHYIQSVPISVGAGPRACPDSRVCPIIAPTILSRQTYGVLSNTPYVESIDPLQNRQTNAESKDFIPSFQSNQTYGLYSYTPSLGNNDPPSQYKSPIPETTIPSQSSPIDFMNPILSILWFFGICIYLIRVFRGISAQNQLVRSSEPASGDGLQTLYAQCASLLSLKRLPQLRISPSPCIPFLSLFGARSFGGLTFGARTSGPQLFSPLSQTIILPPHLLEPPNRDGLRYTILHELAHYKRNDSWWLLWETCIGAMYFFHPLVPYLRKQIERERESLCDRDVINATEQPAQYADFLLNQVWQSSRRIQSACAIPILGQSSAIGKRVKEILANTRITRFIRLRNALVLSALLVLTVPLLALKTSTDTQDQPQSIENQSLEYNRTDPDYLQWIEWIRKNINLHENNVEYKTVKAISQKEVTGHLFHKIISLDTQTDRDYTSEEIRFYYPYIDFKAKDKETGESINDALIMSLRPADRTEFPPNYFSGKTGGGDNLQSMNPHNPTFYTLVVTKEGYMPYFFSFDFKSIPTLTADGEPELLDFPSIPEILLQKATCSIRAKVRYNGNPIQNKQVSFAVTRDRIYYTLPKTTISEEESTFLITGIEPGDMKISCRMHTDTESYRCYPKPVHVAEGECAEVTFDVTPRIQYEITLQPTDSKPIGLFKIAVPDLPEADRALLCAGRKENNFFTELPEGRHTVRLQAPGYKPLEFDPSIECSTVTYFEEINVRRGSLTLVLEPDPDQESPNLDAPWVGKTSIPAGDILFGHSEYYLARARFLHCEGEKSIFHIIPRMQSIDKIEIDTILPDGKFSKNKILTNQQDWSYDPESHRISLWLPIDPNSQQVTIFGVRSIPWQWKTQGPIEPGSVKASLQTSMNYDQYVKYKKDRGETVGYIKDPTSTTFALYIKGEPKIDYVVDEKEGNIQLHSRLPGDIVGEYPIHHWISYRDYRDPAQPTKAFEGRIGFTREENVSSNKNLDSTGIEQKEIPKEFQIPIESTHDPAVYTSSYFLKKETLKVSIASRNDYKLLKGLIQDEDYEYDSERSLIKVLKSDLLDRNKELLLVYAEPRYDAFIFHRLQLNDLISVSVNSNLLQKEKDYTIDYAAGTVRLASPELIHPGTPFRIDAGNQTVLASTK